MYLDTLQESILRRFRICANTLKLLFGVAKKIFQYNILFFVFKIFPQFKFFFGEVHSLW